MRLVAYVALIACLSTLPETSFAAAVCAKVKLVIPQKLTLERDAFDAELAITNTQTGAPLEALNVTLEFRDDADTDVASMFFVTTPDLDGVGAINGNGTIAAGVRAQVHWLLIPSPGAGGEQAQGIHYRARAHISYRLGGEEIPVSSTWADFTVFPQPLLDLDYVLPRRVRSDDPFTAGVVEPAVPFDLGLRIRNIGFGPARSVQVVSAQPKIVENDLGLLIDFSLVGSEIAGVPGPGTLFLNYGDIAPSTCKTGVWVMQTSLSGWFTEFGAAFTHSEKLGGADTSLLNATSTRWMLHRVRADHAGADELDDFIVEAVDAPATTKQMLPPDAYYLLNSNCAEDPVARIVGTTTGSPTSADPTVVVAAELVPGFNVILAPDPLADGTPIRRAQRQQDSSPLHPQNAWTGQERDETSWIFVFDLAESATQRTYIVSYDMSGSDIVPPTSQLAVASGPFRDLGTHWVASPYTVFLAEASDAVSGVASIEFRKDGLQWQLLQPFYFSTPGEHQLELRATDAAGNTEAAHSYTIEIDTAAPVIDVSSPEVDAIYRELVGLPIAYGASDAVAHEISISAQMRPLGSTEPGLLVASQTVLHTSDIDLGSYELTVVARDWLDQQSTLLISPFHFFPEEPVAVLSGVADGSHVQGPVTFAVEAVGHELQPPQLQVDGADVVAGEAYNTEGEHTAVLVVTDSFGQQSVDSLHFTLDNSGPEIVVSGVADGASVLPGTRIEVSANDLSPVTIVATLDGAPYTPGTPVSEPGAHQLLVTVDDAAGNSSQQQLQFTVISSAQLSVSVTQDSTSVQGARVVLLRADEVRSYGGDQGVSDGDGGVQLTLSFGDQFWLRVDGDQRRDFFGPFSSSSEPDPLTLELPTQTDYLQILHVAPNADPQTADGSVELPFASLASALEQSDFGTLLKLAVGDYHPQSALTLAEGVQIFGGHDPLSFVPSVETAQTTIHGDLRLQHVQHVVVGELRIVGGVQASDSGPLLSSVVISNAAEVGLQVSGGLVTDLFNLLLDQPGGTAVQIADNATVFANLLTIKDADNHGVLVGPGSSLTLDNSLIVGCAGVAFSITSQSTLAVTNSLAFAAAQGLLPAGVSPPWTSGDVLQTDPLLVDGPRHNAYLSQIAAGQGQDSPALNAGSVSAQSLQLSLRTTASNGTADQDLVDLGYHAWPRPGHSWDAGVGDARIDADSRTDDGAVADAAVADGRLPDTLGLDTHIPDAAAVDGKRPGKKEEKDEEEEPGCGCGSISGQGIGGIALLIGMLVLLRRRRRACLGCLLLLGTASIASAAPLDGPQPTVYYGRSFGGNDALQMMGLTDNTEIVVTNTDTQAVIYSGTLDRYGRASTAIGNRHFKVVSGSPVFAYLGYDCCNFGGTFYYPTTSFSRRVGNEFIFFVPVQSATNRLYVLAYEDTTVTLYDQDDVEVTTQALTAPTSWAVPVSSQTPYRIVSTGRIALVSNTGNGYDAVPASSGDDTGDNFLFMTHGWGGGGYTVFAYEDAHVTVTNIANDSVVLDTELTAGTYIDRSGTGHNAFQLEATGRVGLWAGDFEGGTGVAALGDDLSFHQGIDGLEFWFHTQREGSTIFSSRPDTHIVWTDIATATDHQVTLGMDQYLDLPTQTFVHLLSDQPIVMESFGGSSLNDFGNLLRPVPPGGLAGFKVLPETTTVTAGQVFAITVTAADDLGQVKPEYEGTVRIESSDGDAVLPASYTYSLSDQGVHLFDGVVLYRSGTQYVAARDIAPDPDLVGAGNVTVLAGPATASTSHIGFDPAQPLADGASAVDLMLHASDIYGNPVAGLAVTFSSSLGSLVGSVSEGPVGTYRQSLIPPTTAATAQIQVVVNGSAFLTDSLTFFLDTTGPGPVVASASGVASDGFTLEWTGSTANDLAGYYVATAEDGQTLPPGATLLGPTTLQQAVAGLTSCTRYQAAVWAEDLAGNLGTQSNVVTVSTVLEGAPSAPPTLTAVAADGFVQLSWQLSTACDVMGYIVYRRQLPDGQPSPIQGNIVIPSFTDESVVNGESYGYTVRAVDREDLESLDSPEATSSPLELPAPDPVNNLVAQPLSMGRVVLSWDIVASATVRHFLVYRAADNIDLEALPEPVATVYTTSYQDTPPDDGIWAYSVVWVPDFGKSSQPAAAVTALADSTVPTSTVTITPSSPLALGAASVDLTASEPLAETPVLTASAANGAVVSIELTWNTGLSVWQGTIDVTEQSQEGEYHLRWTGVDQAGNQGSGPPLQGAMFTIDRTAPEISIELTPTPPLTTGTVAIAVTASEPLAQAPQLTLELPTTGSQQITLGGDGLVWTGGFEIPAGTTSGVGTFTVQTTDASGNVGDSILSGASFDVDTTAPEMAEGLHIEERPQGVLRVLWTAPAEAATSTVTYRLVRQAAPGTDPESATVVVDDFPLTVFEETPPADGDWDYAVRCTDVAGNHSVYTAFVTGHSDLMPPAAPTAMSAQVVAGQVELSWQPPAGEAAVAYRVWRAWGADDPIVVLNTVTALSALDVPPADGDYHYSVTAFDAASNEGQASAPATVTFDEAPPVVTIGGVESNTYYNTPVTPEVTTQDATEVTVEATLNGQPYTPGVAITADGRHTLAVVARDSGLRESLASVVFTIDQSPPMIEIAGVAAASTYHQPVVISYTVTDDTAVQTVATLDSVTMDSGTQVTVEGPHTLLVHAVDQAGNSAAVTVDFELDLPPPAPDLATVVVDLDNQRLQLFVSGLAADASLVRVYRDGELVAEGANGPFELGAAPQRDLVRTLVEVEVVDQAQQTGPRTALTLFPVSLALDSYGHRDGDNWALARWMIDQVDVAIVSSDLQDLTVGPMDLDLTDDLGQSWFSHTGAMSMMVLPQGQLRWPAVVHSHRELTDTSYLKVELGIGPQSEGARVRLQKTFELNVGWPAAEVAALSVSELYLGAEGHVTLAVTNHGSAPLGLRSRDAAGDISGEIQIVLANPDESETYAALHVSDEGLPTQQTSEGTFVVIGPGATTTFPPVFATIPAVAGDVVRLSANISNFYGAVTTPDLFAVPGHGVTVSHNVTPPPYLATVAPAQSSYLSGQTIQLVGAAEDSTGAAVAEAPVRLRLRRGGFVQQRTVQTLADGTFSYGFTPPPGYAGVFELAADHPSVLTYEVDSTVVVHGLRIENSAQEITVIQGQTLDVTLGVTNPGDVALTGLDVQIEGGSTDGIDIVLAALPEDIAPGATVDVGLSITASQTCEGGSRTLVAAVNEGLSVSSQLTIVAVGQVGSVGPAVVPALEPSSLYMGLVAGQVQVRQVLLRNVGFATWSNVLITQPPPDSFVRVASALTLGDLEPGDARIIDIVVAPPAGTPNHSSAGGVVRFAGDSGDAIELNVALAITTDLVGSAQFFVRDATNQLTEPNAALVGAQIKMIDLENPTTNQYSGVTDANGTAIFSQLPAGSYRFQVSASGFQPLDSTDDAVNGIIEIVPGQTALVDVDMIHNPVMIEFTVTPTTIGDEYDIVLETTFETSVPAPVLTVVPAIQTFVLSPGETTTGEVMLYNMGLVSAWNVSLAPQDSTYVKLTYGVSNIPEIPARGAVTIPYSVHLKSHGSPPPPACEKQCTTTIVGWDWYCIAAGVWVPNAITQTVCVDVPICRVQVNQSTITRVTYIGCPEEEQPPSEPLCITNTTGGDVKLCECGMVTSRGIGLPSLGDLMDEMADLCQDKAEELTGSVAQNLVSDVDIGPVGDAIDKINQAKGLFENAKSLIDAAIASQCDDPGVASAITAMLEQAAELVAEEAVNQVLDRYTGGLIGYTSNELTFDKDCLRVGESACVDPGDPDFSFGGGTFGFCVQCGSCEDPEQRGPDCPVHVSYVDVTIWCGDGGGGSTQSIGGGGGGGLGGSPAVGGACE